MLNNLKIPCEIGKVSDGYHTFDELYEHRYHLFLALMQSHQTISWWSRKHADGTKWDGWIIAGMDLPSGTITYHLPDNMIKFLYKKQELDYGKEWDGHTSYDVIKRLSEWVESTTSNN